MMVRSGFRRRGTQQDTRDGIYRRSSFGVKFTDVSLDLGGQTNNTPFFVVHILTLTSVPSFPKTSSFANFDRRRSCDTLPLTYHS